MKLTLSKKDLCRAVERCSNTIEARGTHPHTGKVRLSAVRHKDGVECMQAYATDLTTQVDTAVEAKVADEGEAAVDFKRLVSIAHAMPDGLVTLKHRQDRLVVSCDRKRSYALPSIPTNIFPSSIEPKEGAPRLELNPELLRDALPRINYCLDVGIQEHLRGLYVDKDEKHLHLIAVGSYIMNVISLPFESDATWAGLLPARTVQLTELLCQQTEKLALIRDGSHVFVETDDTLVGGSLPRSEYPPWRNVLEGLTRAKVARVPRVAFMDMVKAVCAGRSAGADILLEVRNEEMRCSLRKDECHAEDEITIEPLEGGTELHWFLDPLFVLDAAKGANSDFILEDSAQGPVLSTDDGYFYVIAPRRPEPGFGGDANGKGKGKKTKSNNVDQPGAQ